jgi:hypothetical protein
MRQHVVPHVTVEGQRQAGNVLVSRSIPIRWRVLAEIGQSQMQNRPANSATPMLEAGQTELEFGFSLNAWLGRRDAARP